MRVARCRFFNFDSGYGIGATHIANVVILDCLFESLFNSAPSRSTAKSEDFNPLGTHALSFNLGIENLLIDRCTFRYCRNGIMIVANSKKSTAAEPFPPSNDDLASDITIRNCFFDGGWWILPVRRKSDKEFYARSLDSDEGAWRRVARARAQVPRSAARRVPVSGEAV